MQKTVFALYRRALRDSRSLTPEPRASVRAFARDELDRCGTGTKCCLKMPEVATT